MKKKWFWFNIGLLPILIVFLVLFANGLQKSIDAAVTLKSDGVLVGPTEYLNMIGGPKITGPGYEKTLDFWSGRYAASTANSDTYVITLDPVPSALITGLHVLFGADTPNVGACSLNINGLGAKALKSLNNQDPANDYIEENSIVEVVYDGTNFQILSPDANP